MIKYFVLLALVPYFQVSIVGTYIQQKGESGMDGDSEDWTLTITGYGKFKYHYHSFSGLVNYNYNTDGHWTLRNDTLMLAASKDAFFVKFVTKNDKLVPIQSIVFQNKNLHNLDSLRRTKE
ncbi:lipocalin family protein [[Flexibacter] sp. ATCC 35208]|uniref:lipocalin family protein n=1 Tax=[Flexibacter] sp. ATCC 35208 TaxID=1936242 RepID=UPI0009C587C3|nr:lipocalin family protein [[Flexibacter] sp. ATCC 35208]OMP80004.1 hypothetical protein BW716_07250 [[Flexibacter] sp. ATCC 35208]